MKRWQYWLWVPAIIILAIAGYGIMHGSIYVLPISQGNPVVQLFYVGLVIVLGLGVPYWILKLGVHKAHLEDPEEKEVQLKNIPKAQEAAHRVK